MGNNISNTLRKLSGKVTQYANTVYPGMAGKAALRFIDDNFRNQSWEGVPWKPRKKTAKRNRGRSILIDRGILRRGNRFSTGAGWVRIYNDVPYAAVHNNGFSGTVAIPAHTRRLMGRFKASSISTRRTTSVRTERGTTTVKGHTRRMRIPRRQFMPTVQRPSPTLNRQLYRAVHLDMVKLLKTR